MSFGIKVSVENMNKIDSFCRENSFNFTIWNAEDFILKKCSHVELDFDSRQARDKVISFLKK